MATLQSIGRKIAKERLRKRLTQEDLAGLAEVDQSFLSNIENGRKNFSVSMLLAIASSLDIPPKTLLE